MENKNMICYVCIKDITEHTLREELAALRSLNRPVDVGGGLFRHSYCAPGTERWMKAMQDGRELSANDEMWIRRFTLEV
jgi:hypothetical protein